MRRLAVADTVERVMRLVKPYHIASHVAPPTGEHPALCRFCGDPAAVEILSEGDRIRVAVSHDVPICPEFVRACEDAE